MISRPAGAPATTDPRGAHTLAVRHLDVTLDAASILRDVSAVFAAGTLTALLGPNGSGKSTLLRTLAGIHRPCGGRIELLGAGGTTAVRGLPGRRRACLFALVEQDGPTPAGLSVRDVVGLGRTPHGGWFGDGDISAHLDRAGVGALAGRRLETLSGGERQRVHLARALAQEPRWLLLDEPVSHLDLAAQRDLLALARDLADGGVGVIAALHDLNQALEHADRAVVLQDGRVRAAGVPDAVLTPELVREVWGADVEVVRTSRGTRLL